MHVSTATLAHAHSNVHPPDGPSKQGIVAGHLAAVYPGMLRYRSRAKRLTAAVAFVSFRVCNYWLLVLNTYFRTLCVTHY